MPTEKRLIELAIDGLIATVTIDNPPLNVLNDAVLDQLDACVAELSAAPDLRAVIVRAAGEKAFVAGADIRQFPGLTFETGAQLVEKGKRIFDKLEQAPVPTICAIHGYALGGGLELALACDIRIAEEGAMLGLPEVKLGILPGFGGTQRLSRLVGAGKAMELIFSGEPVSAQEAYRIGLVERLVPNGEAYAAAKALAEKIAANAPLAIEKAKRVVRMGLGCTLAEGQRLETQAFAELCMTEDMQEGVQAFLEKRPPAFKRT